MIGNSLALFVLCVNGDITFKDPLMKPLFIPITKILPIFETHKNWINDKLDGPLNYLVTIWSLFTFLVPRWFNLTLSLDDWTFILTVTMIMKIWPFYPITSFLTSSISNFKIVLHRRALMVLLLPKLSNYYLLTDPLKLNPTFLTGLLITSMAKPILLYRDKCYVPKDLKIHQEIVAQYHDVPTAGHPRELETYNALRVHYWWPGMRTFIKNYVKGCAFCQQFKINRHPTKPALMPIPGPISTRPFAQLSMDFITDLPPTKGYNSIFSVVDHGLTKGIILVPWTKLGATANATVTMMLDHVFKRFGLPDKVITDRGPQFASGMFRELMKHLGVQTSLSTAYHPQTDGTTEWFNQEIEAYLSIYCTSHPEDWVDALPVLEFTHNNWQHSDWKNTPFELMMGVSRLATPLVHEYMKYPSVEERVRSLTNMHEEALAAHEFAQNHMLQWITSNFQPFIIGQKVWLEARNLKMIYNKKIAPKCEGPFTITNVLSPLTYSLDLPLVNGTGLVMGSHGYGYEFLDPWQTRTPPPVGVAGLLDVTSHQWCCHLIHLHRLNEC
jgi:hypothetical protein